MKRKINCIMLIDDDEDDNFFHRIVASETGVTEKIEVAESGIQGLDYLKNSQELPELIFLDINMPRMNGWEFMEEYNKLGLNRNSGTIVIMLTTSLNPADVEKSKNIPHIAEFKTKPLNEEMLLDIYKRYFVDNAVNKR